MIENSDISKDVQPVAARLLERNGDAAVRALAVFVEKQRLQISQDALTELAAAAKRARARQN